MTEREEKKKKRFEITTFSVNSRTYKFKVPLQLKQTILEDNDLCLSSDEFLIYAIGSSWEECMSEMYENLECLWNVYVMEIDEKLTDGAKRLKRKLLKLVDEI